MSNELEEITSNPVDPSAEENPSEGQVGLMSEELAKLYDESLKQIQEGQLVKGTIIRLTDSDVLVDVGFKSEGTIPLEEFDDRASLKVGDPVEVLLESVENEEGLVVLSFYRGPW